MKFSKTMMNQTIIKIAYFLAATDVIIGNLNVFKIVKNNGYVACILLVIVILLKFNKKEIKKFIIDCLLIMLTIISYIFSKNSMILTWLLFNLACNEELNAKETLKYTFTIKTIILMFAIFLYFIGVTNDQVFFREGKYRRTLGFTSPNTLGIIGFSIIADYVYLRKDRINWKDYTIIISIGILIMELTNSRSIFISNILLIMMIIVFKLTKNKNIKINRDWIMPMLTIFSFIFMLLYNQNNTLAIKFNDLTSNRLYIANEYYQQYPIKIWGNKLKFYEYWIGYDQTIDNVYLNLLIVHGIIMTVLVNAFRSD